MRIGEAIRKLDDGLLMRGAFYILLTVSAAFLVMDIREIASAGSALPAFDPARESNPVLPPALTEGVPDAPPVQPASPKEVLRQPMKYDLKPGGVLLAEGTINPGAGARFSQEIEARGEYVKVVMLNSPGGSIDDALAMSKLIRERKLDTKVASRALCASSCPIVLAGGVARSAEKDAVIGVHQIFNVSNQRPTAEQAMASAQATTARVARHLEAMGIGAGLWINALETPPDRLYYLTAKEMADFRLTTPAAVQPAGRRS